LRLSQITTKDVIWKWHFTCHEIEGVHLLFRSIFVDKCSILFIKIGCFNPSSLCAICSARINFYTHWISY